MENLPVLPPDAPPDAKGIALETSQSILPNAHFEKPSLFIAGWSLSETPHDFRPPFIEFIPKFDCFLIGYNDRYIVSGADDRGFWQDFAKKMSGRFTVTDDPIAHLPPNHYLIGWRKWSGFAVAVGDGFAVNSFAVIGIWRGGEFSLARFAAFDRQTLAKLWVDDHFSMARARSFQSPGVKVSPLISLSTISIIPPCPAVMVSSVLRHRLGHIAQGNGSGYRLGTTAMSIKS